MLTLARLCSDRALDDAYQLYCARTRHKGHNHDCWQLRFHWQQLKPRLQRQLRQGQYRFSPCRAVKVNSHSIGV